MRNALIAALAAVAATLGDLVMLYVSNSRRPELLLPEAPADWLWVGALLGVLGIPLYALGYRAASRMLEADSRGGAQAVFLLGSLGAAIGAVIHGLTALQIRSDLEAGVAPGDPLASVASWGPALPALWALAAILVFLASAIFGWQLGRVRGPAPRLLALVNPAVVTVALVGVGMTTPLLRAFLVPAAPNFAHFVFFAACARARYGRSPGPQLT